MKTMTQQTCVRAIVVALVVGSIVVASGAPALAAAQSYDDAAHDNMFDQIGDWFATVGKLESEKSTILAERHARRGVERGADVVKRGVRRTENQVEDASRRLGDKLEDVGRSMRDAGKGLGRPTDGRNREIRTEVTTP